MNTLFTTTAHCETRVHCRTCRDKEGGRCWRESLATAFELPNGEIDFECPRGKPWGYMPKSRGLGDTVAKAIKAATFGKVKPCGGCKKRQARLNKLVPYKQ